MKSALFFTRFLIFPWVIISLFSCSDRSLLEEEFQQTLVAMEEAIENENVVDFMAYIDESYNDIQSRTWHDIRQIAQLYVLRSKNPHLFQHITQLNIGEDKSASIVILLALTDQPIDSVESLSSVEAELMQFNMRFQYDPDRDEKWKVVSARWKRADQDDFLK